MTAVALTEIHKVPLTNAEQRHRHGDKGKHFRGAVVCSAWNQLEKSKYFAEWKRSFMAYLDSLCSQDS